MYTNILEITFPSKTTQELDGTGILSSFLTAFVGCNVQFGKGGEANGKKINLGQTDRQANQQTN